MGRLELLINGPCVPLCGMPSFLTGLPHLDLYTSPLQLPLYAHLTDELNWRAHYNDGYLNNSEDLC